MKKFSIGTRGSQLALKQADIVKSRLSVLYPDIPSEIVVITTTGDKILDTNLALIGGKGLFIKEIEEQLQAGSIDIAVHSMKDMQAKLGDDFAVPCVLEREDARDCFISAKHKSIKDLPKNAVVGTSSSRRAAQLLKLRSDLRIIPFRGNINTRIRKLEDGVADATFLAAAGLNRIGLMDKNIMHIIEHEEMLPAISQGVIGLEIMKNNHQLAEMLSPLNHKPTYDCISAERSFMRVFEGSCTTPIAAHAIIKEGVIHFNCLIAKPDGSLILRSSRTGKISDAEDMGMDAALELKEKAGDNFFD